VVGATVVLLCLGVGQVLHGFFGFVMPSAPSELLWRFWHSVGQGEFQGGWQIDRCFPGCFGNALGTLRIAVVVVLFCLGES